MATIKIYSKIFPSFREGMKEIICILGQGDYPNLGIDFREAQLFQNNCILRFCPFEDDPFLTPEMAFLKDMTTIAAVSNFDLEIRNNHLIRIEADNIGIAWQPYIQQNSPQNYRPSRELPNNPEYGGNRWIFSIGIKDFEEREAIQIHKDLYVYGKWSNENPLEVFYEGG